MTVNYIFLNSWEYVLSLYSYFKQFIKFRNTRENSYSWELLNFRRRFDVIIGAVPFWYYEVTHLWIGCWDCLFDEYDEISHIGVLRTLKHWLTDGLPNISRKHKRKKERKKESEIASKEKRGFTERDLKKTSSSLLSSSCRAGSTDIHDPLSPLFPIFHRLRQVFRTTSRILT